jgi:ankyrin repeat protein
MAAAAAAASSPAIRPRNSSFPLDKVAIIHRLVPFVGDTVKAVGKLAAVSCDFRDALLNYSGSFWKNAIKKDADGAQYAKISNCDVLYWAVAAMHDRDRLGDAALSFTNPFPSAKEPVEPLAEATLRNKPNIVRALLAMGADPLAKDKQGNQMVIIASLANNVEVLRPYLERMPELAKAQHHTFGKNYAIHFTCQTGNEAGTRLLVENGADPNARGDSQLPPLVYAARFPGIIKFLVDTCKQPVDGCGRDGRSVVHDACLQGCEESLKVLIERGADLNKKDKDNRTPLDLSSKPAVVELLKSKGAKKGKELAAAN